MKLGECVVGVGGCVRVRVQNNGDVPQARIAHPSFY